MARLRITAALAVLLTASACDGTAPEPRPSSTVAAPATSAAAAKFRFRPLDLCLRTDLTPLADLGLRVESAKPEAPLLGSGSSCFWKLKTADGHMASMKVEAVVFGSTADAKTAYEGQQDVLAMSHDGEISGLGDQAEGRTQDKELEYKHSEYLIYLRQDNMRVKVWLSVGGKTYTTKSVLKERTTQLIRATLATVTTEWKPGP